MLCRLVLLASNEVHGHRAVGSDHVGLVALPIASSRRLLRCCEGQVSGVVKHEPRREAAKP